MRIAFLVSGMYREFDFLAKSLETQNLTKYDFYMSTWNSSNQKYKDSELYKNISNYSKNFAEQFDIKDYICKLLNIYNKN